MQIERTNDRPSLWIQIIDSKQGTNWKMAPTNSGGRRSGSGRIRPDQRDTNGPILRVSAPFGLTFKTIQTSVCPLLKQSWLLSIFNNCTILKIALLTGSNSFRPYQYILKTGNTVGLPSINSVALLPSTGISSASSFCPFAKKENWFREQKEVKYLLNAVKH